MEFLCKSCGKNHSIDQISFGADAPAQWNILNDDERQQSELTNDQCIINAKEETHFFVRGCLDVPIQDSDKTFTWGVWTSLSEKSFTEMHENWRNPERAKLPAYFGWLCTQIPTCPDTMFLKTSVQHRDIGLRPIVAVEPTDHALSLHQQNGIARHEIERIISSVLHEGKK